MMGGGSTTASEKTEEEAAKRAALAAKTTTTTTDDEYEACLAELAKTISGKNRNLPGSVTWEAQFATLQGYVEKLELREFLDNANTKDHHDHQHLPHTNSRLFWWWWW